MKKLKIPADYGEEENPHRFAISLFLLLLDPAEERAGAHALFKNRKQGNVC